MTTEEIEKLVHMNQRLNLVSWIRNGFYKKTHS